MHHSYRKFCENFGNHCLQAEILSAHSQITHFQNGHQEVTIAKYNPNKRPKIPLQPSNITMDAQFIPGIIFALLLT